MNWPDGLVYNGHFQGTREVQLYTVSIPTTILLSLQSLGYVHHVHNSNS